MREDRKQDGREYTESLRQGIVMEIIAPRGRMILLEYKPHRRWRKPTKTFIDKQQEVIKAFMEQHSHD